MTSETTRQALCCECGAMTHATVADRSAKTVYGSRKRKG
jgi:hypothetical protein